MEAHVAAGNPAEALGVYERCRRLLADELGTYPSPETESVYRGLLEVSSAQPRAVAVPEPRPPPDEAHPGDLEREPGSVFARRFASRKGITAAAVTVALTGAAIAAFALDSGRSSHFAPVVGDSVGVVDSHSGHFAGSVGVGATPTHVAVGEGAIWVTSADDNSVSRIDPVTRTRVQTITVGSSPNGIAVGNHAVWVTNSLDGTVSRIDPATNQVVQRIDVGNAPVGIVYARGSIWVANTGDGTITRIDQTAATRRRPQIARPSSPMVADPSGPATRSNQSRGSIRRPETSSRRSQSRNSPRGRLRRRSPWVANSLDGTVMRIDPRDEHPGCDRLDRRRPTAVVAIATGLGKQRVRRHAGPHRPTDEQGD
jgi:YVTN family beta-propeller protein